MSRGTPAKRCSLARLHPHRRNGPHVGRRVRRVPSCTAYLIPPRHRQDEGTRTRASRTAFDAPTVATAAATSPVRQRPHVPHDLVLLAEHRPEPMGSRRRPDGGGLRVHEPVAVVRQHRRVCGCVMAVECCRRCSQQVVREPSTGRFATCCPALWHGALLVARGLRRVARGDRSGLRWVMAGSCSGAASGVVRWRGSGRSWGAPSRASVPAAPPAESVLGWLSVPLPAWAPRLRCRAQRGNGKARIARAIFQPPQSGQRGGPAQQPPPLCYPMGRIPAGRDSGPAGARSPPACSDGAPTGDP